MAKKKLLKTVIKPGISKRLSWNPILIEARISFRPLPKDSNMDV
jgi:hypothetical protein